MAFLSRIKNWVTLEILTADDLNTEFNNIVDNVESGADVTDATNVNAAGAVMESDFNAATFLYAVNDNTPVVKTRAEVMALLSGQAGADFSMGTHKITAVTDPTADQDAATKKFVDDKIKAPGEIGGTTPAKINCTTIDLDGGQIAFPATAAASAGANTLDDYEEGTYNPTLTCSTSGSYNLAAALNTLAYTKIGRLVQVQGRVQIESANSPHGWLKLSIPFTPTTLSEAADEARGCLAIDSHGGSITNLTALAVAGAAYVKLSEFSDAGVENWLTESDVDTAFYVTISITYISE